MVIYDSFPPLPPLSKQQNELFLVNDVQLNNEDVDDSSLIIKNEHFIRSDGRRMEELRPIKIRTSIIENADGSAYFSIGNTKVLCSVYGPNLCKQNSVEDGLSISAEYTIGSFCRDSKFSKSKIYDNNNIKSEEKMKSLLLEKVIYSVVCHEKYKRNSIECYFYVIDDDGSAFSAAICSACLALCNAKIEIIGLFSSINIITAPVDVILNKNDTQTEFKGEHITILDPTYNETLYLENSFSSLEIGLCTVRNQVIYLYATGNFFNDSKRIEQGFSLAEAACSTIVNEIKDHLIVEFQDQMKIK